MGSLCQVGMDITAVELAALGVGFCVLVLVGCPTLFLGQKPTFEERIRRSHGLTCPWDPQQLRITTMFCSSWSVFYLICAPQLWDNGQWYQFSIGLHCCLAIGCVVYWLTVSLDEPCVGASTNSSLPEASFCHECQTYYEGMLRKHCRICCKCVVGFDHHCTWLNTCISTNNYIRFITTLVTCTATLTLQGILASLVIYHVGFCDDRRHSTSKVGCLVGALSVLAISTVVVIALALLLGFHALLTHWGITTHTYLNRLYEEEKFLLMQLSAEGEAAEAQRGREASITSECTDTEQTSYDTPRSTNLELSARPSRLSQHVLGFLTGSPTDPEAPYPRSSFQNQSRSHDMSRNNAKSTMRSQSDGNMRSTPLLRGDMKNS